jgi:hypothetical protein
MTTDESAAIRSVEKSLARVRELGRHAGGLMGATTADLLTLKERYRLIPEEYLTFLRLAGRGAGPLFRGNVVFFPEARDFRTWADELLAECGHPFALEEDDLVFHFHQGYQFLFLRHGPPGTHVLGFDEREPGPQVVSASFAAWLSDEVDLAIHDWNSR